MENQSDKNVRTDVNPKTVNKNKRSKIPLIGTRGLVGALLFAWGAYGLFTASSWAKTEKEQSSYEDGVNVDNYRDAVAQNNGYGSFTDYLTKENGTAGIVQMCVGAGLFVWGVKKYGIKKPENKKTTNNEG